MGLLLSNKKDKAADLRLRKLYGRSLSWYYRQLKEQGGGCYFCGRKPKPGKRLNVDHAHRTNGPTRGLLCMICNRKILGMIEKWKVNPKQIVKYLLELDPKNPLLEKV